MEGNRAPVLEAFSLTRRFGEHTAVDGFSVSVKRGEVFGLLGPNGAGKTTILKMLTTLLPPTSGNARIAGFDIVRQSADVRRVIGYVPQLLSADGALTGYENLLIFAKLYDIPRADREARIRSALAFMGLVDAAQQVVRTYSGGMIRRLELAEAMLHRPRVLFLDEPTVGLDPLARNTVWQHIEQLRADYGTTIVLTTHLMGRSGQSVQPGGDYASGQSSGDRNAGRAQGIPRWERQNAGRCVCLLCGRHSGIGRRLR